ncbi:FtsB family cell division protein [Bifidobacterium margollesii]|nr:septum formation initiator family protein [Bifidobacterium margollesii]
MSMGKAGETNSGAGRGGVRPFRSAGTGRNGSQSRSGGKTGGASGQRPSQRSGASFAPVTFFLALIIVALGTIQLVSTFHTYALNLVELNSLRNQEAALVAKKASLENDIARWDDSAYVTAQARERLGFVFPGERSVRVLHPEAVGGSSGKTENQTDTPVENNQNLPWYKDMLASFEKADEQAADDQSSGAASEQSGQTGETTDGQTNNGQTSTTGR